MTASPGFRQLKGLALRDAQPLNTHLELTYACSWRCVFCYNPRHHDVRRLSGDEWIAVLDDLRALGTLWVTLTGGEPTKHPDFLRIAAGVRERSMALRVFTNGSLVDDALADRLAELRTSIVELSIHGSTAAVHDGTTERPGSFDAVLAAVERLQSRSVPVLLKTPLTRMNEHQLDEILAIGERLRVPMRVDGRLTAKDDGDMAPLAFSASPDGVRRLMRRLKAVGQLPNVERTESGTNCGLGRLTLAVDPEGNVFPCLQWRHRAMGNVRTTPLLELWRGSEVRRDAADVSAEANRRLLERNDDVSRFPFCPALAAAEGGDPLAPTAAHVAMAELVAGVRAETA